MKQQNLWDKIELKDGMMHVELAPLQSAQTVKRSVAEANRLAEGKKYDFIVDASKINFGDGTGDDMAIKLFNELPVKRFAIFGANPQFANLGIRKLADAVGTPESFKFFRKEEDALEWLANADSSV